MKVMESDQPILRDVSLIATTLNEAQNVEGFLERISQQSKLPAEVVVVDGGSDDATLELLRAWTPPDGVRYTVISSPRASISRGRNLAVEAATGTWIAVTDAGAYAEQDWLERLSQHFRPDVDVVSGFFAPQEAGTFATALASAITPTLNEVDASRFLPSSRSVAIRKDYFVQAGGYPEWLDYCEDLVLDLALKAEGASFVFEPRALVSWEGRSSLNAYFRQYFRYARGDGKANLWPRRHAVRYAAYAIGLAVCVVSIAVRSPVPLAALIVGFVGYIAKPLRRVVSRRGILARPIVAVLLVPVIALVGDVAKMLGYPAGRLWLRRRKRGRIE